MILFVCFHWRSNTWLVLVNLPFSLIGSVAAIAAMGAGLSVGAMVGLVTVFGISARNAILLLAHYEHLVENEGHAWNAQTVLQGAQERLVPILMTAAVTALGLAPLAIGLHRSGQEIEGPMAVTVLGGLLSSTLLNLVVLPALAERMADRSAGRTSRRTISCECPLLTQSGQIKQLRNAPWHRPAGCPAYRRETNPRTAT
jgi:Cu/Ag efflux pump CusA